MAFCRVSVPNITRKIGQKQPIAEVQTIRNTVRAVRDTVRTIRQATQSTGSSRLAASVAVQRLLIRKALQWKFVVDSAIKAQYHVGDQQSATAGCHKLKNAPFERL
jgi:hypothetical protein